MVEQNPKELELLDEYLGVPPGTTYGTLFGLQEKSLLRQKLLPFGIELNKHGDVPKEQRPEWRALVKSLGIGPAWWLDPDVWDVPPQDLPTLEL